MVFNVPLDMFLIELNKSGANAKNYESVKTAVHSYCERILSYHPALIILNVCYKRSATPSKCLDTFLYNVAADADGLPAKDSNGNVLLTEAPEADFDRTSWWGMFYFMLRDMIRLEIDPFAIAVDYLKSKGQQVWFSVRMNDHHFPENPSINAAFALEHPEYTITPNSVMQYPGAHENAEKAGTYLNYACHPVRNRYLEYLAELIASYPIDGIELDWLRTTPVVPAATPENRELINSFMREAKRRLRLPGRKIMLGARIKMREEENLLEGLDAAQWIADGSLDCLTISNFFVPTCFEPPIAQWRASIAEKNLERYPYQLFCGCDWAVTCAPGKQIGMLPDIMRGFRDSALYRSADDIYVFNQACSAEMNLILNPATGELEDGAKEIIAAACGMPGNRAYISERSAERRYPISLTPKESISFVLYSGTAKKEKHLILGTDRPEFSADVDGCSLVLQALPTICGRQYNADAKSCWIYTESEAAPCMQTALLPSVCNSRAFSEYRLINESETTVSILWIEIQAADN